MEQLLNSLVVFSSEFLSNSDFLNTIGSLNLTGILTGFVGLVGVCIFSYILFKLTLIGIKLTVLGSLIYGALSFADINISETKKNTTQKSSKEDNNSFSDILREGTSYGISLIHKFSSNESEE